MLIQKFGSQHLKLDAEVEGLKLQEEDLRKRVQKAYYGMVESIELQLML